MEVCVRPSVTGYILCAAKIMHPTLFDMRDPGTASYFSKFREECHLLSLARHPNVVQYLVTSQDPDTQLPVLLMKLCDESLTAFLERSPGPMPYHIQVNICLDIALGLVYLHSNGVIHRDLTGNNILIVAGPRAKITDFGMSKLAQGKSGKTALTMCPGNLLYMSPEALNEAKSYTAKLNIFSFGVIVIQILTRQFPSPTERFRTVLSTHVSDDEEEEVRQLVPETQRRQAHLQLIPDTHSLKPIALQCLKKRERHRPSAVELSENLYEQKQSLQYIESVGGAQVSDNSQHLQYLQCQRQSVLTEASKMEDEKLRTRITELEKAVEDKDMQIQNQEQIIHAKNRELGAKGGQLRQQQRIIQVTNRQLQEHQHAFQARTKELNAKDEQLQTAMAVRERKERELQEIKEQLFSCEHSLSQCHKHMQEKSKVISNLQQTISAHERKIQQLELQRETASRDQPHQKQPVTTECETEEAALKDISKMRWRKGKKAPEKMVRGAVAVHQSTAYFRAWESHQIYSLQHSLEGEDWCQLRDNPNMNSGLTVIDGLLTSVGGFSKRAVNTLLSLREEGGKSQWSEIYPPMPTPRTHVACVSTEHSLIAAGGLVRECPVATVEVMNKSTKQWNRASPLPVGCSSLSATICRERVYLGGGYVKDQDLMPSKSVITCFLSDLLPPLSLESQQQNTLPPGHNVWSEICSLQVKCSTLVSINSDLLAIGGVDDKGEPRSDVYRYDSGNVWTVTSRMNKKRWHCLALTHPEYCLIVVGGFIEKTFSYTATNIVEIFK